MGSSAGPDSLGDLLVLEELDTNLYRALNPADDGRVRLYGGQVAAQSLAAAAATVEPDRVPHSLHGFFLRGGRPDRPTIMAVDRDRDGRSFSARHVNAIQDGKVIFSALASFQVPDGGLDRQLSDLALDAGHPDELPEEDRVGHNVLLDIRHPEPDAEPERAGRFWVRPRGILPDDPVTRACVLTYMSDLGWAFAALDDQGHRLGGPSLDHAVWLQRPVGVTEWLFVQLSPVSIAATRGIFTGTIHGRDGGLAAFLAQETLLRPLE
jgi:acyl-CoA thioesterase-2